MGRIIYIIKFKDQNIFKIGRVKAEYRLKLRFQDLKKEYKTSFEVIKIIKENKKENLENDLIWFLRENHCCLFEYNNKPVYELFFDCEKLIEYFFHKRNKRGLCGTSARQNCYNC